METTMERVFFSRSQLSCMICVTCILSSKCSPYFLVHHFLKFKLGWWSLNKLACWSKDMIFRQDTSPTTSHICLVHTLEMKLEGCLLEAMIKLVYLFLLELNPRLAVHVSYHSFSIICDRFVAWSHLQWFSPLRGKNNYCYEGDWNVFKL